MLMCVTLRCVRWGLDSGERESAYGTRGLRLGALVESSSHWSLLVQCEYNAVVGTGCHVARASSVSRRQPYHDHPDSV